MSDSKIERPLSPHLQIYRPQLTSVMSIMHRFAGAALAAGTLAVAWGLSSAALGPDAWEQYHGFFQTLLGRLMAFGWSVALFYHMCNGVRHLIWDTVHMLEIRNAYRAGYIVLLMTAMLTILMWWKVLCHE